MNLKSNKKTDDMAEQQPVEAAQTERVDGNAAVEGEAAEAAAADECDALSKQVAELNAKIAELNDKNLRMMAEFDNYRKRTLKEKAELIKTAGEGIFVDILPVVDDFERAIAAIRESDDAKAIAEGVELIYNKFLSLLERHDVHAIAAEGQKYDADIYDAIAMCPAPSEEQKNTILECTQKGYMLGEKIIRHPKVVVGQ